MSLVSSMMASLRRKANNKTDSSQKGKKSSGLGARGAKEEDGGGNIEISRQITAQMLMQIEAKLVIER